MTRAVVYSPGASRQLAELYTWIAEESGYPDRAEKYLTDMVDFCDGLAAFPFVGSPRDDVRPGLRTIGFRRRVVIAFAVSDDTVAIHGVYYGGRDYDALLNNDIE